MDCSIINYCGKNGYLVRNNRLKSDLISELLEKYKINLINFNKMIYNDSLLEKIMKEEYIVSFLSGGYRSLLWIFEFNGIATTLIMERNISDNRTTENVYPKIMCVSLELENLEKYINSVWEVEVNKKPGSEEWEFIITDLLVLKEERYEGDMLEKIEEINNFHSNLKKENYWGYNWNVKRYYLLSDFGKNYVKLYNEFEYYKNGILFHNIKTCKEIVFFYKLETYNNYYNDKSELNKRMKLIKYDDSKVEEDYKNIVEEYKCIEKLGSENEIFEEMLLDLISVESNLLVKNVGYGIYQCYGYNKLGDRGNRIVKYGNIRFESIEELERWKKILMKPSIIRCKYNEKFKKWKALEMIKLEKEMREEELGEINELRERGIYFKI